MNAFGTHCGGVSQWSVASGGRMGQVMGEDSVEVAPPPTDCTQNCQAQNQVRGRFVVLGFPFPVPTASRLTPPLPPDLKQRRRALPPGRTGKHAHVNGLRMASCAWPAG